MFDLRASTTLIGMVLLTLSALWGCDDSSSQAEPSLSAGAAASSIPIDAMMSQEPSSELDMSVTEPDLPDEGSAWRPEDAGPADDDQSLPSEPDMSLCGAEGMPPCEGDPEVTLTITAPLDQSSIPPGSGARFEAEVTAVNINPRTLAFYLVSSIQGALPFTYDPDEGRINATLSSLVTGVHTLTLTALAHPEYEWSVAVTVTAPCQLSVNFEEELDPAQWFQMGEAHRTPGGWLEMTHQMPNSMGGIFLTGIALRPNDLDLSFKVAVEAELNLNVPLNEQISDGLAMTFWNISVDQIPELIPLLSASGSKMGYGIYKMPLEESIMNGGIGRPEAFTVEFDTYYNRCGSNPHQDPTPDPHIAITYDGYLIFPHHTTNDAGELVEIPLDEVCNYPPPSNDPDHPWASTPTLIDGAWHEIRIVITSGQLTVWFDDEEVISSSPIGQQFKGGILAFSGGSGAVPAHLKFDDLSLSGVCR